MRVAWTIVGLGAVAVVVLLLAPVGGGTGPTTPSLADRPGPEATVPVLEASQRATLLGASEPPPSTAPLAPATSSGPTTTALAGPVLVPVPRSAPALSAPELVEILYRGQLGRLAPDEIVVEPAADPPAALADGVAPLTGLPVDPSLLDRPAILVKIDNSPRARPQAGLVEADLVYEQLVEGGTTRFAAVLHSADAPVGPVRSFRSTDIGLLSPLGEPMLSWSGANAVFAELLRRQPVIDRGTAHAQYWRDGTRGAPHNLMTDTTALREGTVGAPPPPHFVFRSGDEAVGGTERPTVDVRLGNSTVSWRWNGVQWERWTGSIPHSTTVGPVITTDNVVLQRVRYLPSGLEDAAGSSVPEAELVGTGSATILTAGRAVEATWTRSTLGSVTTFTDAEGRHVGLTPGRTWVVLVEG
ncbi:MAG: DUF3048 domain-containing protein [Actinomycetota bacterium]